MSQDVEPRSSLATSNPSSPSSPTTSRKNAEALIGEIHAAVPSPPQQLLSSAHKIMREDEGDVPFLDLRGTVCVKLQVRYNTPYYKQHNILQQKLYIFGLSDPFFFSFFLSFLVVRSIHTHHSSFPARHHSSSGPRAPVSTP